GERGGLPVLDGHARVDPIALRRQSIRGGSRDRATHTAANRSGRPCRGTRLRAGNLLLRAAQVGDRLYLHLCADGTPALRGSHAGRDDPGDHRDASEVPRLCRGRNVLADPAHLGYHYPALGRPLYRHVLRGGGSGRYLLAGSERRAVVRRVDRLPAPFEEPHLYLRSEI